MSEGLWGFLGVIIGGTITIISQWLFLKCNEKAEIKKTLASKFKDILIYNKNVDNATSVLINFIKIPLTDNNKVYGEIIKDFQRFIPDCVSQWPDYFLLLNLYFKNIIKDKKFIVFKEIMEWFFYFEKGLNNFFIPAYDIETLKYWQNEMINISKKIEIAKEINENINNKYFKLFL